MLQIVACGNESTTGSLTNDAPSGTDNASSDTPIRIDNSTNNETIVFADINLSWAAPSEREDNSPISLSEVAGYKVYYGTSKKQYTSSININDGTAENHTFKNFSSGTYYFALTTYDTEGRESQYSTEVKIVV